MSRNTLILTYRFEIPTTMEPGESIETVLKFIRENPEWPLAYLRKVEGEVIAPTCECGKPRELNCVQCADCGRRQAAALDVDPNR